MSFEHARKRNEGQRGQGQGDDLDCGLGAPTFEGVIGRDADREDQRVRFDSLERDDAALSSMGDVTVTTPEPRPANADTRSDVE